MSAFTHIVLYLDIFIYSNCRLLLVADVTGKYMFLETSSPRVEGNNALFVSTNLAASTGSCLTFWYHMNGNDIGTLNFYLRTAGKHFAHILTYF